MASAVEHNPVVQSIVSNLDLGYSTSNTLLPLPNSTRFIKYHNRLEPLQHNRISKIYEYKLIVNLWQYHEYHQPYQCGKVVLVEVGTGRSSGGGKVLVVVVMGVVGVVW